MTQHTFKFLFGLLLTATTLPAQISTPAADLNPWSNPEFLARLNASYGVLSGVEPPQVTREEMLFLNNEIVPLVNAGNLGQAAALLRRTINEKSNANLDFTYGTLLLQQREFDAAIAAYQAAIRKFPDFLRAHKNLGISLSQLGRCEEAVGSLTKSIELGEKSGDLFGVLGYCYLTLGRYSLALDSYRLATVLSPGNLDWHIGKIRSMTELQLFEEAIGATDELLQRKPDDSRLLVTRANAFIGLNRNLEAISTLETLRRIGQPATGPLRLLAELLVNYGTPSLAVDPFRQYLELKGEPAPVLQAADVLVAQGHLDVAENLLKVVAQARAVDGRPADLTTYKNLNAKIAVLRNQDDRAIQLLDEIVAVDPLNAQALFQLAKIHASRKDYAEAEFFFERAKSTGKEQVRFQALVEYAVMLVAQGKLDVAARQLREALGLKDDPRIREYLESVERYRSNI